MPSGKKVIRGPEIKIIEPMERFEIIKRVISSFIDFEKDKKGKGIEFKYPVENLIIGEKLYIRRPGVKWNFDLWSVISILYHCETNDVDLLAEKKLLKYRGDPLIDALLKTLKWLYIMEDIIYWHYEGRAFLYNFLNYVINEKEELTLQNTLTALNQRKLFPDKLKELLESSGLKWQSP